MNHLCSYTKILDICCIFKEILIEILSERKESIRVENSPETFTFLMSELLMKEEFRSVFYMLLDS